LRRLEIALLAYLHNPVKNVTSMINHSVCVVEWQSTIWPYSFCAACGRSAL